MRNTTAVINIQYPGKINLPINEPIYINSDNRLVKILITSHGNPVEFKDFTNRLIETGEVVNYVKELSTKITDKWESSKIDKPLNRYLNTDQQLLIVNEVYYTQLVLIYLMTEKDTLVSNQKTRKILQDFIYRYRILTEDFTVLLPNNNNRKHIVFTEYHFSNESPKDSCEERQALNSLKLYGPTKKPKTYISFGDLKVNYWKQELFEIELFTSEEVYKNLSAHEILVKELIVASKQDLIINENSKSTLINCFTAIEIVTTKFISTNLEKLDKKSKLYKKYVPNQTSLYRKLKVYLPTLFSILQINGTDIIKKIDDMRNIRNEVIHEGRSYTINEANKCMDNTIEFVNNLEGKYYG